MMIPCFFTDGNLKKNFKINLESQNFDHANSVFTIIPINTNFGIETRYNKETLKEMSVNYDRL